MKKVMVFGTFDLLHKGHKDFLRQAKEKGDQLIVLVAQDSNVFACKKINPVHSLEHRMRAVRLTGLADSVVEGHKEDFFSVIRECRPDIICLGYDQDSRGIEREIRKNNWNIEISRLRPYKEDKYKSTLIRKGLFP